MQAQFSTSALVQVF